MNENEKNIRKNFLKFTESRYMKFVGGNDLVFSLIALVLLGIVIFIFEKVSYVFDPFIIVFKTIAAPIIVSLILFYLFNPIVNMMERYRIPRVAGISIIYLAVVGVITLIVNLLIPIIGSQVDSLVKNSPQYLEKLINSIDKIANNTFFSSYYSQINDWLNSLPKKIPSMLSEFTDGFGSKIATFAETIANIGVVIVTTPFVLFFMLKDGHHFKEFSTNIMPPKFRKDFHDLLEKMSVQVGSYIQGQIIVSFCIGILLFIGYSVIGLKYSLVLASIAAVTSVVPYLGPTIAISPAIVIAAIRSPWMLLKLAVVWTLVQFVEGHFISPNIMGKTLKIHPLTIIFILLCAGKLLGIVGVILGIPGYAILKVLVTHLFQLFKRRYNRFYGNDVGEYDIKESNKIVE
ncbi:cell elongation protein CozEb [Staphylococcus aureus]|uniref:cell elongation protein CozEb n=1 Tax=Staphylococcus aureus TaxID=1280 RepID=UPI0016808322|nr:cell elongation protein CozEb [Staphylococcus aureus]MBD1801074.1 AI-2E family transporter [Staphylococcus aureus]MBU8098697.1 cell elongation protein CozEb [Staphylococcus aureus]MBU8101330.1 cell elongation protein CozEb [Staphylococcus aureus]MBU8103969.1 cell elongation protein CozEb [Staphylococcus aureus]MBU8106465.1 cell elongation protein CozEb [Staphylococcus aureus]